MIKLLSRVTPRFVADFMLRVRGPSSGCICFEMCSGPMMRTYVLPGFNFEKFWDIQLFMSCRQLGSEANLLMSEGFKDVQLYIVTVTIEGDVVMAGQGKQQIEPCSIPCLFCAVRGVNSATETKHFLRARYEENQSRAVPVMF